MTMDPEQQQPEQNSTEQVAANVEESDEAKSQDKEQERDRHKRRDRDRSSRRRRRDRGRRSDDEYHDRDYDDDYGYNDDEYSDYYDDRQSNWRDSSRERDRRRDRDYHRDDDHRRGNRYERPEKEQPYHTIIIKYLPFDITEYEIRSAVVKHGLNPIDVRVVKNRKESGSGYSSSRGFAFVEFVTVAEATHWMEVTQGVVDFDGGFHGIMFYSIPKDYSNDQRRGTSIQIKSDWNCTNCGARNFKRRDVCFKCSAEKKGGGYEEMSSVPTSTLLFRNLDTLSTEDSVLAVLSSCATLPIKKIKIAKDNLTGVSCGFCYVEMHSVNEAMQLYNLLSIPGYPLTIDNREVNISYACTSATYMPRETSANIASAALAAAQWSHQASDKPMPTVNPTQYNYSQYYQQQQQQYTTAATGSYATADYYQQDSSSSQSTTDSVNAAAAVAQNALQQMQVAKEMQKKQQQIRETIIAKIQQKDPALTPEMALANQAKQWTQKKAEGDGGAQNPATSSANQCMVTGEDYAQYPVPDISTYVYDESCGYYYDSATGLYYDAHSQYYYNADRQIYFYWDGERQTYIPATSDNSNANAAGASADSQGANGFDKNKGKGKDKQDKVKIAKKIAKDMERWAKTLNQKKESSKSGTISMVTPNAQFGSFLDPNQSASTDICFSMLEKKATPAERQAAVFEAMKKNELESQEVGLVAEYGGGSDSEEDDSKNLNEKLKQEESKLIDWSKIACLLCKRQFPNKQVLQKHQQMSDLHKQNLEVLKKSKFTDKELADLENKDKDSKYRDRAKERRMKYGEPEPPKNNRLKDIYYKELNKKGKGGGAGSSDYEEPTKKGIGSENIGNKMLKKMGWNEGQGLGRTNQGMTGIIEAKKRNASAGLGMQGGTHGATAGDSYRDTVKKMMQSRYNDLDS